MSDSSLWPSQRLMRRLPEQPTSSPRVLIEWGWLISHCSRWSKSFTDVFKWGCRLDDKDGGGNIDAFNSNKNDLIRQRPSEASHSTTAAQMKDLKSSIGTRRERPGGPDSLSPHRFAHQTHTQKHTHTLTAVRADVLTHTRSITKPSSSCLWSIVKTK